MASGGTPPDAWSPDSPHSGLVCVLCPTSCHLQVRVHGDMPKIAGAQCRRGREYAESEMLSPVRTFTGTVRVNGGERRVVSVRSEVPVPKRELLAVATLAATLVVQAPVERGDKLAELSPSNFLIATSDVRLARQAVHVRAAFRQRDGRNRENIETGRVDRRMRDPE